MFTGIVDHSKVPPFILEGKDVVEWESNASVIAKISWKYRVKPTYVAKYILGNKKNISVLLRRDIAASANSVTDKSLEVGRSLSSATGLTEIKGNYAHLRGFLDTSAHGLIAEHKKWCAKCYAESMQASRQSWLAKVFDKTYWSLKLSNHCAVHLCSLSERCGKCYQRQPYVSTLVEPGYCHYCFADLSIAPALVPEGDLELSSVQEQLLKYDVFYPEVVTPSSEWSMKALARNLRALIQMQGDENLSEVAFRCGVSEHTLKDWCSGRHSISLESLVNLIEGLGLSRASELFGSPEHFMSVTLHQFSGHFNFRQKQDHRSVIPEISSFFQSVLSGREKAISRADIAKRFGVSKGMIEHAFKDEVRKVSKLYLERKEAESLKVKDSLQYEMNRAVRRCGAKGRKLDWSHILAELEGIDFRVVRQKDLDLAKAEAIKSYVDSRHRDRSRDLKKLLCD